MKYNLNYTKKKITVGTHDGWFHVDDILAVALLKYSLPEYNVDVVRSRDVNVLSKCDLRVDVGGVNNGVTDFDHHQDEKLPCAVVLVWTAIAKKAPYYQWVKTNILDGISALDVDYKRAYSEIGPSLYYNLNSTISDLNYLCNGFEVAVEFGVNWWTAIIAKASKLQEEEEAIKEGEVVNTVLETAIGMNLYDHTTLLESMGVKYVLHPHVNDKKYWLKSTDSSTHPIPKDIKGVEYRHHSGFAAIFTTYDLARKAIEKL